MTESDKEYVLDCFAVEPAHDRTTLERYINKYPELSEELIDLAAEFRLSANTEEVNPGVLPDPKLKTAWEDFLAAGSIRSASTARIDVFSEFKGAAFVALAGKLEVPRSILTAIRDRLVLPSSVPTGFIRRFADATNTTVELVRAYLDQDSQKPVGLAFKSDEKPSQQGQTTFRHLVENTTMSEPQRILLLRECEEFERN